MLPAKLKTQRLVHMEWVLFGDHFQQPARVVTKLEKQRLADLEDHLQGWFQRSKARAEAAPVLSDAAQMKQARDRLRQKALLREWLEARRRDRIIEAQELCESKSVEERTSRAREVISRMLKHRKFIRYCVLSTFGRILDCELQVFDDHKIYPDAIFSGTYGLDGAATWQLFIDVLNSVKLFETKWLSDLDNMLIHYGGEYYENKVPVLKKVVKMKRYRNKQWTKKKRKKQRKKEMDWTSYRRMRTRMLEVLEGLFVDGVFDPKRGETR